MPKEQSLLCKEPKSFGLKEKQTAYGFKGIKRVFGVHAFVCIGAFSGPYKSAEVTGHYGAIMLIDGMGGYVLTAVTAFAAATVITALCIKKRK